MRQLDLKNNQIKVEELLKNREAKTLLYREFPQLMNFPVIQMAGNMTLQNILQIARNYIPGNKIRLVMEELRKL